MKNLLFLILTLALMACNPSTDPEAVGQAQSDATVDEIVSDERLADQDYDVANATIHPVYHGSVALEYAGQLILIDPHNGAGRYTKFGAPDLVMITHTHGDHMDVETLKGLKLETATLVAPKSVADALKDLTFADVRVLANGETTDYQGFKVEAVPAYNLPTAPKMFHPKGEFNGYVITLGDERFYFSGDTQDVPEMRELDNIDYAFVCMNQPYTMTVEAAADAVAEMMPAVVYPYHYRNQDGSFSDLEQFETLVKQRAPVVEVRMGDWYD